MNLKYDEDPKYSWMIALFEPLCGSALHRPIKISESTLASGKTRTWPKEQLGVKPGNLVRLETTHDSLFLPEEPPEEPMID